MNINRLHNSEYQELLDQVPVGIQQCLNDSFFTIVEVNQGFLNLFGYSREEIKQEFQDRFMEMIHPCDRRCVRDEAADSAEKGTHTGCSYRVACKDGSYKRVLDQVHLTYGEHGEEQIFFVLVDTSGSKDARNELRLTLERHQIIMDQATDIIFEWNLREDIMSYSANWYKKFGYEPVYSGYDTADTFRHFHPDDLSDFKQAMAKVIRGQDFSTVEARVQDAQGRYIWCRFRSTVQYDEAGQPFKAVGVITDIDKEKRMIDDLRKRAERDALTGLYNREETEHRIRYHLENRPDEICALFMIDTDNFKQVNDNQGHIFGDAVLSEAAAGMQRLTRRTDVVGRIGGDEFTIFLKSIPSKEVAVKKAEKLISMFRELFQEEKHFIRITCSVGVAFYPEDGVDFQSLYHSADLALYQAKSQGKDQYVLFDSQHEVSVSRQGYSSIGTAIDSNMRRDSLPADLVNYVFQVLYDTRDINRSIQHILEIVGKRFDVSRVYIFETSDDQRYISNTYEWCNEGIVPEKDNLQRCPYALLSEYTKRFREGPIFYCRDIYTLSQDLIEIFESQGIRSVLHCAIMEQNKLYGMVGFDECTGKRMWTKEEIDMLSLISQLITTFLLKKRISERNEEVTLQLNTILDNQDSYVYVIEQNSYKLLYFNHKIQKQDARAKLGMTCYDLFFKRNAPCGNCPLSDGNGEIYNPQYDVWTKAQASSIKWGSVNAYLLSCFDITQYKRPVTIS